MNNFLISLVPTYRGLVKLGKFGVIIIYQCLGIMLFIGANEARLPLIEFDLAMILLDILSH